MPERELLELFATFKGNVQGVGFRATAKLYAEQLKLNGFVRNLHGGEVELCAQGEKAQLEHLLKKLRHAFGILDISLQYRTIATPYSDFRIVR